jgi:hypothetical protein
MKQLKQTASRFSTAIVRNKNLHLPVMMLAVAVAMFLFSSLDAHAVTAPAAGSFMYDAYDIVVNSLLKGALGFVVAIFVFVTGIAMFFRQMIIPGVVCIVCTALIIKSDAIIASLGMLI